MLVRSCWPVAAAHRLRHAEVHHQRVPVGEHHVVGLDVAVHHAVPMGVREPVHDLAQEAHRLRWGQRAVARQPVPQRVAVDERHDVVEEPVRFTRIKQRQDVRGLQLGRDLDLAQEALPADGLGQLGAQHLDRHPPIVLQVLGQVHRGHAARPELALDVVAVGEGGGDLGKVAQRVALVWGWCRGGRDGAGRS